MKKAQGLVEYALVFAVIGVVAVTVMINMADKSAESAKWMPGYVDSFQRE